MAKIKKCRTCGKSNPLSGFVCMCGADISGVIPTDELEAEAMECPEKDPSFMNTGAPLPENDDACPTQVAHTSIELSCNNQILKVCDGDILGRNATGKHIFSEYPTVSREHAKIVFDNGEWHIIDLDSTNGTYVDKERVLRSVLNRYCTISLSEKCELTVR